ncbi:unnamed protein product [Pipistrellus nathusii]|uniref:Uncharacterized protein n=1 Tax=Pipistrellus nathusii TaxID=59473 RepID=A0ABN9ZLN6_PIPNA
MARLPAPPDRSSLAPGRCAEAPAPRRPESPQVSLAARPGGSFAGARSRAPRSIPPPGIGAPSGTPSARRGPGPAAPSRRRGRRAGARCCGRLFSCRRLAPRGPRPPDRRSRRGPARPRRPALGL